MLPILPLSSLAAPLLLLLASAPQPVSAIECNKVKADGVRWDISALAGDHEVNHVVDRDDGTTLNTTYVFNICGTIKRKEKARRGNCNQGAWACAFAQRTTSDDDSGDGEDDSFEWSVAGNFVNTHGAALDDHQSRLKNSKSNEDQQLDLEGLLLEYNGGKTYVTEDPVGMIMELRCKRPGADLDERKSKEDDEDEKDGPKYISYKTEPVSGGKSGEEKQILRLQWDTAHACEDSDGSDGSGDGDSSSSGWGFFTWLIIILFMLVAAYLIFGSWLNYNRHGARGWDLLPHGDTLRDIPYLLKDWSRKVVDTVQGRSDGRGGYNQI